MEKIENTDELFPDDKMLNFRDLIINDPAVDENVKNKLKHVDANGMRWLLFLYAIGPEQTSGLLSIKSTADFLKSQIFGNEVPEPEKRNHKVTLRLSEYEYGVISELVPDGSSVSRYLRELVVEKMHNLVLHGIGIITSNCIECEPEEEAREKVVHLNMTATEFKEFEEICDTYKMAKGLMARLFIFGKLVVLKECP